MSQRSKLTTMTLHQLFGGHELKPEEIGEAMSWLGDLETLQSKHDALRAKVRTLLEHGTFRRSPASFYKGEGRVYVETRTEDIEALRNAVEG